MLSAVLIALSFNSFSQTEPTPLHSNVHIGLTYPLSTNGANAALYSNTFSVHAISGVSYREEAICMSGIASIIKDSAKGAMLSGFVNIIGGSASGMQAAGFMNIARQQSIGLQAAGFINLSGGVDGAQAAGFANISTRSVTGAQAAGFVNVAKNVPLQAGGFMNLADTGKAQMAGFINVARKINGAQVSGYINIADEVRGAQVAGFINVARKVKGVQVSGLINIADSCDYPIGIINIIRHGEKALGVMVEETGTTFVTFRSGGKYLYGIYGIGYNGSNYRTIFASQAGLGAHLPLSKTIRLNAEATTTSLTNFNGSYDMQSGLKFFPSVRIWNLELFAGPSFNHAVSETYTGTPFHHTTIWSYRGYYYTHELYVGLYGGIQFHF